MSLGLGFVSMRRVFIARHRWARGGSRTPVIVRWAWAALTACCALTSVMLVLIAWHGIAARGIHGAIEASLCSRIALYTAALAYGFAWLERGVQIRWPRFGREAPKLLPPASGNAADDAEGDDCPY